MTIDKNQVEDAESEDTEGEGRRFLVSMRVKLICIILAYVSIAGLVSVLSYDIIAQAIGSPINETSLEYGYRVVGMGKILHVDVSPEGDLFAVTTPVFVHLYDTEYELLRSIGPINDSAWQARFSPRGSEIAVLTNSRLEVWSINGERLAEKKINWPIPEGMAVFWDFLKGSYEWSPDGEQIALPVRVTNIFGSDNTNMNCSILFWDWANNQDIFEQNLTGLLQSVEFSPSEDHLFIGEAYWVDGKHFGRVSTYTTDSFQYIDGVDLGQRNIPIDIGILEDFEKTRVSITLYTQGDTPLKLYTYPGWVQDREIITGHEDAVSSEWLPDYSHIAIGHNDGYLGVYDISGEKVSEYRETQPIQAVGWLTKQKLVGKSCMGRVSIYDISSGALHHIGPFYGDPITLSWNNYPFLFSLWVDINYTSPDWIEFLPTIRTARSWNPETGNWVDLSPVQGYGKILCLENSPEGNQLALGMEKGLLILRNNSSGNESGNGSEWEIIHSISTDSWVTSVDYSSDGTLIAYNDPQLVVIDAWNIDEILRLPILPRHLVFSSSDRRLALSTEDGCTIVDPDTMSSFTLGDGPIATLAWAPDGGTIALARTGMGKINDPEYRHESVEVTAWDTYGFDKKADLSWTGKQHRFSSGLVYGSDISMTWINFDSSAFLLLGTHFGDLLLLDKDLDFVREPLIFPCPIHSIKKSPNSDDFALGLGDGTIRIISCDLSIWASSGQNHKGVG